MSSDKLGKSMRVRINGELNQRFASVHAEEGRGRDKSATIRELMDAAVRYYELHGNLYPPWDLVRKGDAVVTAGTSAVVSPIINGHGNHVRAIVRSKRKA